MGFLDRLMGREEPELQQPRRADAPRTDDEIAVERYRYLLRTAPPETIEQVHEETFAKLTPEQRTQVFRDLSAAAPAGEAPQDDDAHSLARATTRAEMRAPGTAERAFGGGGGMGFGSMLASSMLGTIAGYVIGSALVSAFLPGPDAFAADGSGADGSGTDGSGADGSGGDGFSADGSGAGSVDAGGAYVGDGSGVDFGGGDWGGGGDFGGGDFGGF